MANRVAFNPQDRFVVTIGNTLIVTTQNGDVFGHDIIERVVGPAFQFTGAKAAFNGPKDRFVVTIGNQLIVITQSGDLFGHDVVGRDIGPAFKFTGSKAAFNGAQDRFVVTIGNQLIVITQNGDVFGHDVSGRHIGDPFQFTGSKAAFNGSQDRFVMTFGNTLIVTTQNGDVFGHDVVGRNIGAPFRFTGSRMAFNPQDRFVVVLGNTMIVSTQDGSAFGADISSRDIGPIIKLNHDVCIRVHFKLWATPNIALETMRNRAQETFGTAGIGFMVVTRQDKTSLDIITFLRDLDVGSSCSFGQLSNEQVQLFNNRDNVGEFDLAIHFVRTTNLPLNGCAAHPAGIFGAVVTQIASQWSLAHEVAHVLGLGHVSGENSNCPDAAPNCCSTQNTTRIMTGCGTGRLVGTPVFDQGEIDALRRSNLTRQS